MLRLKLSYFNRLVGLQWTMHPTMTDLFLFCKRLSCHMVFNLGALHSAYGMYNTLIRTWSNFPFNSCFPHIINLACKAMVNEMSGLIPEEDSIKRLRAVIHDVSLEIYIWIFTQGSYRFVHLLCSAPPFLML